VDEAKRTVTFKITSASFPNMAGEEQTRVIETLTADEFKNTTTVAGGRGSAFNPLQARELARADLNRAPLPRGSRMGRIAAARLGCSFRRENLDGARRRGYQDAKLLPLAAHRHYSMRSIPLLEEPPAQPEPCVAILTPIWRLPPLRASASGRSPIVIAAFKHGLDAPSAGMEGAEALPAHRAAAEIIVFRIQRIVPTHVMPAKAGIQHAL
jgi:hypothetical protein